MNKRLVTRIVVAVVSFAIGFSLVRFIGISTPLMERSADGTTLRFLCVLVGTGAAIILSAVPFGKE